MGIYENSIENKQKTVNILFLVLKCHAIFKIADLIDAGRYDDARKIVRVLERVKAI